MILLLSFSLNKNDDTITQSVKKSFILSLKCVFLHFLGGFNPLVSRVSLVAFFFDLK
jgi:hypothetical protein